MLAEYVMSGKIVIGYPTVHSHGGQTNRTGAVAIDGDLSDVRAVPGLVKLSGAMTTDDEHYLSLGCAL